MNKKEIKEYLASFSEATGLKVEDQKEYVLKSSFGDIKVTFRLSGKLPTVFTRLLSSEHDFDIFREFATFGYNRNSGKNNYYSADSVYWFLHNILITHNIVKSDTAMTAKIVQSVFDKTRENKMYDISIFRGGIMQGSVLCISYMEATQTALNLNAEVLRVA